MTLTIRPATASDAEPIGRLAKQFARYLRSLGDPTGFKLDAAAYRRDGFGPQAAFAGLIAEVADEIVGYLLYHFGYDSDNARRTMHVLDLFVTERARHGGAGLALMKAAAGVARKAGACEKIWSVYHTNTLAARFYARLGARPVTDVFLMRMETDKL